MTTIPLTKRGAEKLKEELQRLKTKDRPAVIAAIAEARSHGDLGQNGSPDLSHIGLCCEGSYPRYARYVEESIAGGISITGSE